MEKKQNKKSAWILALLMLGAFTLALQLGAVGALAQDQDSDGFSDALENSSGFTLTPGMSMATDAGTFVTSVTKCGTGSTRQNCVDPAKQDLFVIIQRATKPCSTSCGDLCGPPLFPNVGPYGSDIAMPPDYPNPNIYGSPLGPLQWVPKIATGFTTHEIYQNPPSATQLVTQAQGGWYAVKIVEDLNPCSSWMGLSTPGTITPAAPGSATVWPEKIMNWIDKACSQACFTDTKTGKTTCYYVPVPGVSVPAGYVLATGKFTCTNAMNSAHSVDMKATPLNLAPLYHDFIKNVISHEASHMMHLAFGSGTSADNHWPAALGTLMEQSIGTKATNSKGNITVNLYISNSYASQDPGQHALK
jgi:hypothetical protein